MFTTKLFKLNMKEISLCHIKGCHCMEIIRKKRKKKQTRDEKRFDKIKYGIKCSKAELFFARITLFCWANKWVFWHVKITIPTHV